MRSRRNSFLKASQGLLASIAAYNLHDALIADTEYSKTRTKNQGAASHPKLGMGILGDELENRSLQEVAENPPILPWRPHPEPR